MRGSIPVILVASLLCGCESQSSDVSPPSREVAAVEPEQDPRACRVQEVVTLARTLAVADPLARRDGVSGLRGVCDLPPALTAFLDRPSGELPTGKALDDELAFVLTACEGGEKFESPEASARARAARLHDACGFERLGLADRDAWLRSEPTSVVPFAAMVWLQAQGVAETDARALAEAMLLRARRAWGVDGLRLAVVGGALAAVPEGAIEVSVTPSAIFVGGVEVLALEDGALPEAKSLDDDPLQTLERALLAERETQGEDEEVVFAIVPDAEVRTATLLHLAEMTSKAGAREFGFVVQSEPLTYGFVRFDTSGYRSHGDPQLVIDAEGFTLEPPGGGAAQRVGDEGSKFDFEALAARAEAYTEGMRNPTAVVIEPRGNPTATVLLGAVQSLRGAECATEAARCWFDDVHVRNGFASQRLARGAGILGLLSAESGAFLASPHGGAFASETDDESWAGGLTGTEVGEAFGVGGLGLAGVGGGGDGSSLGHESGPRVRHGKPTVKGALEGDIVRRIVRAHINEVRFCYRDGLTKDPELAGTVTIDFTIDASGKVGAAEVDTDVGDVGACVAKAVKRWTFPEPSGGGVVAVTYPFVLEPG